MRSVFISFCFILFLIPEMFSQEYSYTHYDTKDGLAGSTVYTVAQSADGFIWFGTEAGLSRFDGQRFKTFTTTDGLPSNEILGVFIDSKGRVWLTPFGNAISYYFQGKIHNQKNDSTLKKVHIKSLLNGIAEDEKGTIILQSAHETQAIKADNSLISIPFGMHDLHVPIIEQFTIRDSKSDFPQSFVMLPPKVREQITSNWIFTNTPVSARDNYYLFKYGDTVRLVLTSGISKQIILPHNASIKRVDNGELGIYRSTGGILLFDKDNDAIRHRYFMDYTIQDVLRDKENNLWFTTKGSGVFKVSNNRFKNLFAVNDKGTTYIRDIQKIGPYIYVGGHNNKYWRFDAVDNTFFEREIINKPREFSSSYAFLQQIPDKTFINCGSSDFLNLKQYRLKIINMPKTAQVLGDTILVADITGACILNKKTGQENQIYKGRTTCAYRHGNKYYIGTLEGLYVIGPDFKTRFLGNEVPQFRKHISFFAEGDDGILWVGSYGDGVAGYKDGKIVANFNLGNGLSSNQCRCLFYTKNTLWVGTEKGLNKIDVTPGVYKVTRKVTADDGLNSNGINAIYNDGNIVYVGTPGGVTVFDERNIATHAISEIIMTGITVSGRSIDPLKKSIQLRHKDNNISFEYSGISFLSEKDIVFKYRILGLNNQWRTTREQVLSYPSLPSGDYTLQLIAVNKFHEESKPWEFHFKIAQSIPETIWFKIIAGLSILLLIILAVIYIIRRGHRKATKDLLIHQKMNLLEQMALRAQMNPHFIFNCLNAMQQYILDGDVKKANFYLSKFAALVRETLDNATRIFISVEEEINYLTSYIELERLQLRDRFDYTITVSPDIDRQKMKIPNMVLQPYVENAIKHGLSQLKQHGRLLVMFNLLQKGHIMECIVEDNGAGIGSNTVSGAERKFPSKGMSITDKRIQTLNQLYQQVQPIQIWIEDLGLKGLGTGTKITIHFPIYYDQDNNNRR